MQFVTFNPSYGRIHSQLDKIRAQLRLGLNPEDPSQPAVLRQSGSVIADIERHIHELVRPFATALHQQAEQRAQQHENTLNSLREDKQVLELQLATIETELYAGREQVARMDGALQEMQAQRERDRQALEQSQRAVANAMKAKDDVDALLVTQHQEHKKQTQAFTKLIAAASRTESALRQTLAQLQQQHQKSQGHFEKLKEAESEQRAQIKTLKADLKRAIKQNEKNARTQAKTKIRA